jgi:hypothetical protein
MRHVCGVSGGGAKSFGGHEAEPAHLDLPGTAERFGGGEAARHEPAAAVADDVEVELRVER